MPVRGGGLDPCLDGLGHFFREDQMGICLVLGGSKPLPRFFVSVIYPQNDDLTKLLKSARKKVPQSARLSAGGGGAKAKRAMPKAPQHEFEEGFPYTLRSVQSSPGRSFFK